MLKLAIGVVAAAVAMFLWGFLYFGTGVMDPFAHMTSDGETAISEALRAHLPAHATYYVPDPKVGTMEEWGQRLQAGPMAEIHFNPTGDSPMNASVMVQGFIHMLITAALLALAMQMIASATPTYLDRLKVAALIGFTMSLFMHLGAPIWWHYDWWYAIVIFLYDFIAVTIAGAVLAYFVPVKQ